LEEISNSSFAAVEPPAAKDTTSREKEDNRVETEEELGIFQLLYKFCGLLVSRKKTFVFH
jgi:hypothetical protein